MKNSRPLKEALNLLIIISFTFYVILCLINYFPIISQTLSTLANIITVLWCPILLFVVKYFFDINSTQIKEPKSKKLHEIKINRKQHITEILKTPGITILYGESGAGKTYLLNQLVNELKRDKIPVNYISNNYFLEIEKKEFKNKKYIFFDQFERALQFNHIINTCNLIQKYKNKNIIISIRKEYLGDLLNLFDSSDIHLFKLTFDKSDQNQLEKHFQKIAHCTLEDLKNNDLYSNLLCAGKEGLISLIQLTYICKIIQYKEESYIINGLNKYNQNYNKVIEEYMKSEIDNFENSFAVYQIIYLLCLDVKSSCANDEIDFQNICIQPKRVIDAAVSFLIKQKWIMKIKCTDNTRTSLTQQYEISHDYFLDCLLVICKEQLDEEIKRNIEYYHISSQSQNNANKKNTETYKERVNNNINRFLNKKNKLCIDISLIWILLAVFISNVLEFNLNSSNDMQSCFTLIAYNIIIGISIYYVYNYCYYFLSIHRSWYFPVILSGAVSCVSPFLTKEFWALPFGFAIFITGIVMAVISHKLVSQEKKFFKTRAFIFCFIGVIISILSFFFYKYTKLNFSLAWPLYSLYIVYMFLAIRGHINKTYLQSLVGKVLYGQK